MLIFLVNAAPGNERYIGGEVPPRQPALQQQVVVDPFPMSTWD
jgi:hypothetical protein